VNIPTAALERWSVGDSILQNAYDSVYTMQQRYIRTIFRHIRYLAQILYVNCSPLPFQIAHSTSNIFPLFLILLYILPFLTFFTHLGCVCLPRFRLFCLCVYDFVLFVYLWFGFLVAAGVLSFCRNSVSFPTDHFWWTMSFERCISADLIPRVPNQHLHQACATFFVGGPYN